MNTVSTSFRLLAICVLASAVVLAPAGYTSFMLA